MFYVINASIMKWVAHWRGISFRARSFDVCMLILLDFGFSASARNGSYLETVLLVLDRRGL